MSASRSPLRSRFPFAVMAVVVSPLEAVNCPETVIVPAPTLVDIRVDDVICCSPPTTTNSPSEPSAVDLIVPVT